MSVTLSKGLVISDGMYEFLQNHLGKLRIASYLLDTWVAENIIRTDIANHLAEVDSGDEAGSMSYLPPNRWDRYRAQEMYWNHADAFLPKGRMRGKAGSIIKKVIKDEAFTQDIPLTPYSNKTVSPLTDNDVLEFVTAFQAAHRPAEPFIVFGEAIRYWYYEGNYTQTGSRSMLHTSCMRYGENRHSMRFYAQNPRVIAMACILGSDGKLAARALLWNTPKGIIMDRRYGTSAHNRALVNWAEKNGWHYRSNNETGETYLTSIGDTNLDSVVIPLQRIFTGDEHPYLDTVNGIHKARVTGDVRYERIPGHYNERNAPFVYSAAVLGELPGFLQAVDYGRANEGTRNKRVNLLSDFSHLQEWPAHLVRSDPSWKLDDPEDDEANMALPERRERALTIEAPAPVAPTAWTMKKGVASQADVNAYTTHLQALQEFMRNAPIIPPQPMPVQWWMPEADEGIELDEV